MGECAKRSLMCLLTGLQTVSITALMLKKYGVEYCDWLHGSDSESWLLWCRYRYFHCR